MCVRVCESKHYFRWIERRLPIIAYARQALIEIVKA